MRAEHVARMGDVRNAYKSLVRKSEVKRPVGIRRHRWEDKVKRILGKAVLRMWIGLKWLRMGTGGGFFNHGDEPSGCIKNREFLDRLSVLLASQKGPSCMELEHFAPKEFDRKTKPK